MAASGSQQTKQVAGDGAPEESSVAPVSSDADPPQWAPDLVPVTEEEKQAMVRDIVSKCTSLSQLLQHYQMLERELKDILTDFVIRDMEEECAFHATSEKVTRHTRELLRDPAYLRWAATHCRGEFAAEGAPLENAERSSKWCDADAAAAPETAPTNDGGDVCTPDVPSPAHVASQKGLLKRLPFSVGVAGPIVPVLLGWRQASASDRSAEALCASLDAARAEVAKGCGAGGTLLLVNGMPLISLGGTPDEIEQVSPGASTRIAAAVRSASSPETSYLAFRECCVGLNVTRNTSDVLRANQRLARTALLDDGADIIGVCPARWIARGVLLRAFCIGGALHALENVGPDVSVLSPLLFPGGIADVSVAKRLLEAAVATALSESNDLLQSVGKNVACYLCVWRADDLLELCPDGVTVALLHVAPLSPEQPFHDRFTWSDICGLAKQHGAMIGCATRLSFARLVELPEDHSAPTPTPLLACRDDEVVDPISDVLETSSWLRFLNEARRPKEASPAAAGAASPDHNGLSAGLAVLKVAASIAAATATAVAVVHLWKKSSKQ